MNKQQQQEVNKVFSQVESCCLQSGNKVVLRAS